MVVKECQTRLGTLTRQKRTASFCSCAWGGWYPTGGCQGNRIKPRNSIRPPRVTFLVKGSILSRLHWTNIFCEPKEKVIPRGQVGRDS